MTPYYVQVLTEGALVTLKEFAEDHTDYLLTKANFIKHDRERLIDKVGWEALRVLRGYPSDLVDPSDFNGIIIPATVELWESTGVTSNFDGKDIPLFIASGDEHPVVSFHKIIGWTIADAPLKEDLTTEEASYDETED